MNVDVFDQIEKGLDLAQELHAKLRNGDLSYVQYMRRFTQNEFVLEDAFEALETLRWEWKG